VHEAWKRLDPPRPPAALTFVLVPEVAEVGEGLGVALDTVHLPGLQAAAAQARLVATPTVLLA